MFPLPSHKPSYPNVHSPYLCLYINMYVCIVVTALFGLTVIVGTCVDSRVYDGIGIVISKLTQSLQVP